jgi:hypothetical protein
MAEEATQETQAPEEGHEESKQEEQHVPYNRFKEVNEARKALEDQLAELNEKVLAFEDRDKSETERAKDRAARAEQKIQEMENTVQSLQKGSWVRSAAAEANFHDPEDAFTLLQGKLGQFEDERDAKREVTKLAKSKKHLVRDSNEDSRRPISSVFRGQGTPENGQQNQQNPQQQAVNQERQFAEGLANELQRFRDGWTTMGGGIG